MFNIYETRENRVKLLQELKDLDPCVGLVIAFLDFEWTLRRCILSLGKSPTKEIRQEFAGTYSSGCETTPQNLCKNKKRCICGLDGYNKLWKKEVYSIYNIQLFDFLKSKVKVTKIEGFDATKMKKLTQVKNSYSNTDEFLKYVYKYLRNTLIHGARTNVQDDTAKFVFNFIIACSGALCDYAEQQGKSIYGKKIVRRNTLK